MLFGLLTASGTPYRRQRNELIYKVCPFCNNSRWNLQINVSDLVWHCWACDRGGHIKNTSFSPIDLTDVSIQTPPPEQFVEIPEGTVPIWLDVYGNEFLRKRGVTRDEAIRFSLQYFKGAVYVPYFENKELMAVSVRSEGKWKFYGGAFARENVFYWIKGKGDYIILTEGIFDGIKLARLGYHVFVLFGKVLYETQLVRLLKFFDKIVLALDRDRWGIYAALKIIDRLEKEKVVLYGMKAPDGRKDFGECGTGEVIDAFKKMRKISWVEKLEMRLEIAR